MPAGEDDGWCKELAIVALYLLVSFSPNAAACEFELTIFYNCLLATLIR